MRGVIPQETVIVTATTAEHHDMMRVATRQAVDAGARGDRPIGCVVTHNGRIIAQAGNRVLTNGTELDHAEMMAIRQAREYLQRHASECTLYTTLEPCVMCIGAIAATGIRRIVFGEHDPKRGGGTAHESVEFVASRIEEYQGGVLEAECIRIRKGGKREA